MLVLNRRINILLFFVITFLFNFLYCSNILYNFAKLNLTKMKLIHYYNNNKLPAIIVGFISVIIASFINDAAILCAWGIVFLVSFIMDMIYSKHHREYYEVPTAFWGCIGCFICTLLYIVFIVM